MVRPANRLGELTTTENRLSSADMPVIKSVTVIETPATSPLAAAPSTQVRVLAQPVAAPPTARAQATLENAQRANLCELWQLEQTSARRKLEPEGALTR